MKLLNKNVKKGKKTNRPEYYDENNIKISVLIFSDFFY